LVNFLVLLFLLNAILYKPIMAKVREREARMRGDREKAEQLARSVEQQENRHQEELAKARQAAAKEKAVLLAEAKSKESVILKKARSDAGSIVEEMKVSIQQQVGEARSALKEQMTPLARSIVEKILGRSM
jgi:F-type H+-transporting ATPase subunit b